MSKLPATTKPSSIASSRPATTVERASTIRCIQSQAARVAMPIESANEERGKCEKTVQEVLCPGLAACTRLEKKEPEWEGGKQEQGRRAMWRTLGLVLGLGVLAVGIAFVVETLGDRRRLNESRKPSRKPSVGTVVRGQSPPPAPLPPLPPA